MFDRRKIIALLPLLIIFILLLFSFQDGCSKKESDIYGMPFLAKAGGRIYLAVETFGLVEKDKKFTLFSTKDLNSGNWSKPKGYQGKIKGVLSGKDSITIVFSSGSIIDYEYKDGKFTATQRNFSPLNIADAAGSQQNVLALALENNQLQVFHFSKEGWQPYTTPLKPLSTVINPKLALYEKSLYLVWQKEASGKDNEKLRWAKYEEGRWQSLGMPDIDFNGNIIRFKSVGDELFLLGQNSFSASFFNSPGISFFKYKIPEKKWIKLPPIKTPEKLDAGFTSLAEVAVENEQSQIMLSTGNALALASGNPQTFRIGEFKTFTSTETINPTNELSFMLFIFTLFIVLGIIQIIMRKRILKSFSAGGKKAIPEEVPGDEPVLKGKGSLLAIGGVASPLERAIALAIDIFVTLPMPFAFIVAQGFDFTGITNPQQIVEKIVPAALFYNFFFIVYATISETIWNQTVGKKAMGLYVRNLEGGKAPRIKILIRNLLRGIDNMALPGLEIPFLPAIISMLFSKTNQRIGDRFANTIVVRRVPVETRKIILASASERRKDLLNSLGLDFTVMAPTSEEKIFPALEPHENAVRLAQEKADNVGMKLTRNEIVVAADTIISFNGKIIGKPEDSEDAKRILRELSGSRHEVITGLAIWDRAVNKKMATFVITEVQMNPLSDEEIEAYVASGEPEGKAGAYAIQGEGRKLIRYTSGSYSNVVGLPLEALRAILDELEI